MIPPIPAPILASAPAAGLPWSLHAAVGLALVLGLFIWLAGGRLMRPAFIALGALTGAALAHLFPDVVHHALGEWPLVGAGAVVGALTGWLAFRVLVANTLALVVALAAALGTAAFVQTPRRAPTSNPAPPTTDPEPAPRPQSLEEWAASLQLNALKESMAQAVAGAEARLREDAASEEPAGTIADLTVERGSRAIRAFAGRAWEALVVFWNQDVDPRGRALLLLALALGYLGGLVLGFALPTRAAAVTTAMIGPAVWLPAAAYLVVAMGLPLAGRVPADPLLWLIAWAALAAIGAAVQLLTSRRQKVPAPA